VALAVHVACNLALGGGPWPDSALPMAWLWRANQALADPAGASWWSTAWWYWRPVLLGGPWALASAAGLGFAVFVLVRPWWPPSLRAVPAVLVGCAFASGARDLLTPAWTALFLALLPAPRTRRVPWALAALLTGLAAIVVLHWGVRWYPRDYYVAPLGVAAFAALTRHARCRLLLVVFALAQFVDLRRVRDEPLAGQLEMAMAGHFLASALPAGDRVGCFNSGLVTFHANVAAPRGVRRAVVNLDGVVDARAFAALRAARLAAWLDGERIRFVLDNPVQFAADPRVPHACGPWFGDGFVAERDLLEIARFDVPGIDNGRPGGDSMRLYWRVGRGERPGALGPTRELGGGPDGARYVLWTARAGERLELATADGGRRPLVAADADTAVFVRVPLPTRVGAQLFVAGREQPVLQLAPL
jgi:hypothetical protein